jgi:hypothetical protein
LLACELRSQQQKRLKSKFGIVGPDDVVSIGKPRQGATLEVATMTRLILTSLAICIAMAVAAIAQDVANERLIALVYEAYNCGRVSGLQQDAKDAHIKLGSSYESEQPLCATFRGIYHLNRDGSKSK